MPDHLHGVLWIDHSVENHLARKGAINRALTRNNGGGVTGEHNPMGKRTLGEIIRYFKGRVSFEVHREIDVAFGWSRRFYDRIVRDEVELNSVRQYIRNNPINWNKDKYQL